MSHYNTQFYLWPHVDTIYPVIHLRIIILEIFLLWSLKWTSTFLNENLTIKTLKTNLFNIWSQWTGCLSFQDIKRSSKWEESWHWPKSKNMLTSIIRGNFFFIQFSQLKVGRLQQIHTCRSSSGLFREKRYENPLSKDGNRLKFVLFFAFLFIQHI